MPVGQAAIANNQIGDLIAKVVNSFRNGCAVSYLKWRMGFKKGLFYQIQVALIILDYQYFFHIKNKLLSITTPHEQIMLASNTKAMEYNIINFQCLT